MGKRIDGGLANEGETACNNWLATVTLKPGIGADELRFYEAADQAFLSACCAAGIFQQSIGPRDRRLLYIVSGQSDLAATVLLDIPAIAAEIADLGVNRLRFWARYDASSAPGAHRDGDVTGHGIT
ncbi:hypothetical protein [Erythrobacter sp. WG]|uniref:hypothetical protein n=1 Tax=Erythrobacter sp. WG TaxID=2985510 RepID=UPI002271B847|nr:hypothetical protein [Erythrobacter sp. WG]MCX9147350.1 hypothetical protein [Erythrobacter sp. WG]